MSRAQESRVLEGARVEISQMAQLHDADTIDDDWTGISNPVIRRRIQNRLNQRAYVRRRAHQAENTQYAICANARNKPLISIEAHVRESALRYEALPISHESQVQIRLASFMSGADEATALLPINSFPLSSDHLIVVISHNFFRACAFLSSIIGLDIGLLNRQEPSPFESGKLLVSNASYALPPNLWPTILQQTVPHHAFLDLIPVPQIRDNLLRARDTYDDKELCKDFLGTTEDAWKTGWTGFVIWGDPHRIENWEFTEHLVLKWPWLFQGSHNIFHYTNIWRKKRGEKQITGVI